MNLFFLLNCSLKCLSIISILFHTIKFSSNEIFFLFFFFFFFILYCKLVITYNYSFMFTEFLFLFFFLLNCSLKSLSIISILFHAINILWMNLYEISGISFPFCFQKYLWYVSYISTRPWFRLLTQCETITFDNKHGLEMKSWAPNEKTHCLRPKTRIKLCFLILINSQTLLFDFKVGFQTDT